MSEPRVLIVDDNEDLAENLCEILAELHDPPISCLVATNGAAALEAASRHDLDLALVDLHLPDAAGTDIIAKLRSSAPFAQLIIITGDATIESAIQSVKEGAFSYVLKPFRGDELMETARRALERAHLLREKEQLRADLERSERRHREVVEAVPAFVLGLDGSGHIVLWNRLLEEVTGFRREEMLGQPYEHFVGRTGDTMKLPLKRGGHRLARWQRAEVSAHGDPVTYAMGVDVTDEAEMLRRTLRAERLAAVGTLAAGLAHEVRNPLNSALLQLNVLERRIDKQAEPAALKATTKLVTDEIRRLDRLVSEFLAFAQPRPLELRSVAINDLVSSTIDLVSFEAETHKIRIDARLDPAAGVVQAEPERLRQVLLNLYRNAVEAMSGSSMHQPTSDEPDTDRGTLSVLTFGPDDRGYVRVEVRDTGPGFPEEQPVFDAFYTTKEGGTGLGLAIVHRIVTEHGGSIHVQSHPGATCFSFTLPQEAARASH